MLDANIPVILGGNMKEQYARHYRSSLLICVQAPKDARVLLFQREHRNAPRLPFVDEGDESERCLNRDDVLAREGWRCTSSIRVALAQAR